MSNKIKPEKFRKRSIVALVAGILADVLAVIYLLNLVFLSDLFRSFSGWEILLPYIIPSIIAIIIGLAITAVVCGGVDLKRIIDKTYSKKGKGFDITGIILGGIFLLFTLIFLAGEIIVPH